MLKGTKTSITKILIYHANSSTDAMLSSQQMIINQLQKSKDTSSKLLNYFSTTYNECEISLLECGNVS